MYTRDPLKHIKLNNLYVYKHTFYTHIHTNTHTHMYTAKVNVQVDASRFAVYNIHYMRLYIYI